MHLLCFSCPRVGSWLTLISDTQADTCRHGGERLSALTPWGGRGCLASCVHIGPAEHHGCQALQGGSSSKDNLVCLIFLGQPCFQPSHLKYSRREDHHEKGAGEGGGSCSVSQHSNKPNCSFPLQTQRSPGPPSAKLRSLAH